MKQLARLHASQQDSTVMMRTTASLLTATAPAAGTWGALLNLAERKGRSTTHTYIGRLQCDLHAVAFALHACLAAWGWPQLGLATAATAAPAMPPACLPRQSCCCCRLLYSVLPGVARVRPHSWAIRPLQCGWPGAGELHLPVTTLFGGFPWACYCFFKHCMIKCLPSWHCTRVASSWRSPLCTLHVGVLCCASSTVSRWQSAQRCTGKGRADQSLVTSH